MKNYLSKIYVIHYTKLIERKKHMISEFDKWNVDIPWEIFEPYDQEDISQLDIIEHFDMMAFRGRHSHENAIKVNIFSLTFCNQIINVF